MASVIRRENALLISLPIVGILLPQALWGTDFLAQLRGTQFTAIHLRVNVFPL
jgi:hypothetical protein